MFVAVGLTMALAAGCGAGSDEGSVQPADEADAPAEASETAGWTAREKASYGVGYDFASRIDQSGAPVSVEHMIQGVRDALAEREPRLSRDEIDAALAEVQAQVDEARRQRAEDNRRAGEAFLAEVRQREGVRSLPSGVLYEVVREGDGPSPEVGDRVTVHYEARLVDGTVFDSSLERGAPENFPVTATIPGFSEALRSMSVGSKWILYIPPTQGFGDHGDELVGPGATLVYEAELLGIGDPREGSGGVDPGRGPAAGDPR